MDLNCKQGDLAVLVRSDSGNEGAIVECLRLYVGPWLTPDGSIGPVEPGWWVNRPLRGRVSGGDVDCWCVADKKLRPLRDSDGEDEMLQMMGRPASAPQAT